MAITTGPHGTIPECIEALEAEVQRITELIGRVKNVTPAKTSEIASV
jgi:hypothetical protein